jgi:hypothetical protein
MRRYDPISCLLSETTGKSAKMRIAPLHALPVYNKVRAHLLISHASPDRTSQHASFPTLANRVWYG